VPSTTHQSLVLWIARKMAADGFTIGGYDGPTPQGGVWNTLPVPFEIRSVRPDVWGVDLRDGQFAIGEAKTANDILCAHTYEQLRVFGHLQERDGRHAKLYIAVPHMAGALLDRALARAEVVAGKHLVRVLVPDCFLPKAECEYA